MSRAPTSLRRPWRAVTGVLVAGLTLAGCGTAISGTHVLGSPSRSISVPLRVVACTAANSCVAVGTSGSDVGPSSVGEFRRPNGTWVPLNVPAALSSVLGSAACWANACLVGGTQPAGDLLWTYDASTKSISPAPTPRGGLGISALSCYSDQSCAAVDSTGIVGDSRLSFTSDGGATWTSPLPMKWSANDSITSLSCSDALDCLAAATGLDGRALVEVTHDGGGSWAARTLSADWNSLSSLTCVGLRCVGLASSANGSSVERTQSFGRGWSAIPLNARTNALACTSFTLCVLVGQTNAQAPWLATLHHRAVTVASLRYVPSPLTSVACGTKVCAAIAVSTVLALRP